MKTIAILGPTASGKTALAIELAQKYHAYILSLDSLSIYQEIDIASAKPTLEERKGIPHFGIDVLSPNEHFDVTMFFTLYEEAKKACVKDNASLIIVGGTGFYLKSLIEGLSLKPEISPQTKECIHQHLLDLNATYACIQENDPIYAQKIASSDRYRIEKWLEIFLTTQQVPSTYLSQTKQAPLLENVALFEIDLPRDLLAKRIHERTQKMVSSGLIDEVFALEKNYSRAPQCMKAIGIKEVLDYFDGKYTIPDLTERIALNTIHLAKRQRTFNASQFLEHPKGDTKYLFETISQHFDAF